MLPLLTQYRSMIALLVCLYQATSQQIYKNRISSGQQTFRVNEGEALAAAVVIIVIPSSVSSLLPRTWYDRLPDSACSGTLVGWAHVTVKVHFRWLLWSASWNTAACFCEDDGPVSVIGPWGLVSGALPKCRVFLGCRTGLMGDSSSST